VTVSETSPEQPLAEHTGTLVTTDLNGNTSVWVTAPEGYAKYTWTLNGSTNFPTSPAYPTSPIYQGPMENVFEIKGCGTNGPCIRNGAYRLIVEGFDKCPSPPSEPKYIISGTRDFLPRAI